MVSAAGAIYQPAGTTAIELRFGRKGHDQVDLAVGMPVMRPDDWFHIHDVNTKPVCSRSGLDDAPELDVARFTVAHPACCDRRATRIEEGAVILAIRWKESVEILFQLAVDSTALYSGRDRRDQIRERLWGHAGQEKER